MKNNFHRHISKLPAGKLLCPSESSVPQGGVHSAQNKSKYLCLCHAHPSCGAMLQGSCSELEGDVLAPLYLKWLRAPCENSLQLNLC